MSKYILFNAVTKILAARYDSDINTVIPRESLEVSEELFFKTINEQDGIWSLDDEEIVKIPFPEPSVDKLKAVRLSLINSSFQNSMSAVVASYPDKEISSWSKQEDEARAYQENNQAATPLVDALAAAREIPKDVLVTRIIAKADVFAQVSGALIGKRQKLEDKLNALPADATPEQIEAIVW